MSAQPLRPIGQRALTEPTIELLAKRLVVVDARQALAESRIGIELGSLECLRESAPECLE